VIERARKRLDRKAKKGLRGWPVATVALYGPDDRLATKLAVGIVPAEDAEATDLRRWRVAPAQGDRSVGSFGAPKVISANDDGKTTAQHDPGE
jgi:hypothetical protein